MKAKKQPVTPEKGQTACYSIDVRMTRESLYHMVSVERYLNPSAPYQVWLVFVLLIWLCFGLFLICLVLGAYKAIQGDYYIRGYLIGAMCFLSLVFLLHTLTPYFIRSGIFKSANCAQRQLDMAWNHFLLKNGEPPAVTYEFYKGYFRTSNSRSVHEYSQISCICETSQCLVLYISKHQGYLLDKEQMGSVCISGLRSFLSDRTGKPVIWIQVRGYLPAKSN